MKHEFDFDRYQQHLRCLKDNITVKLQESTTPEEQGYWRAVMYGVDLIADSAFHYCYIVPSTRPPGSVVTEREQNGDS